MRNILYHLATQPACHHKPASFPLTLSARCASEKGGIFTASHLKAVTHVATWPFHCIHFVERLGEHKEAPASIISQEGSR